MKNLLLLFSIVSLTINCKAEIGRIYTKDTLFRSSIIDTTIIFNNFKDLNEYKAQKRNLFVQQIKRLELTGFNKESLKYISDSIYFLNASLEQVLLYKAINKMTKSEMTLVGFDKFLIPAKFISDDRLLSLYYEFPSELKNSDLGLKVFHKIKGYQVEKISKDENPFYFKNTRFKLSSGQYIQADKIIREGKYRFYLIMFTASWCGPCRFEQQQLIRNIGKIDTSFVKLISISIDNDISTWDGALKKDPISWSSFLLENGANSIFFKQNVPGGAIPCNFLLDSYGALLDKKSDAFLLLQKIPANYYRNK